MWFCIPLTLPIFIYSSLPPVAPRRVIGIQTPSGRLNEVYSDEFNAALEPDAAMRLDAQIAQDGVNDRFTPDTTSYWTERTPWGTITLGSIIHRGFSSAVFSVYEFPQLVIKYQVHCTRLDTEIHALLRDAWYTKATHQAIGKSPSVHFISPASGICAQRGGKCDFQMAQIKWQNCIDQQGSLRYMIMDRLGGQSLHNFRKTRYATANGAMRFRDAILVGREMISLIRRLHEEVGIVHGDIHTPNIMIELDVPSKTFRLHLIDFGNSFTLSNTTLPETPIYDAGLWYHELFSQWQIDGFAWSRRDDVIKAIQTMAHLMNSFEYFQLENGIARQGYRALQRWKLEGNWFILDDESDPVEALAVSNDNKRQIYEMLKYVLRLARAMQINERPPYEEFIGVLTRCLDLALPAMTVLTTTSLPTIETSTEKNFSAGI